MASLASSSRVEKLTKSILLERNENLSYVAAKVVEEVDYVQQELDMLDHLACRDKTATERTYDKLMKPAYNKRDQLIRNIPNFWIRSFQNHPEICSLIDKNTEDILRYLTRLEVEVLPNAPSRISFKLNFFFRHNPYFENDVLWKRVTIKESEDNCYSNSTIRWKPGKQCRGKTPSVVLGKRKFVEGSFLDWFQSNTIENDVLADSFKEIHEDPLHYFRRSEEDDSDSGPEDQETQSTEGEENTEMDCD